MRSTIQLIVVMLVGALALSGCSAVRSLLAGDSAGAGTSSPATVAEPSAPRFTFFDSWASW